MRYHNIPNWLIDKMYSTGIPSHTESKTYSSGKDQATLEKKSHPETEGCPEENLPREENGEENLPYRKEHREAAGRAEPSTLGLCFSLAVRFQGPYKYIAGKVPDDAPEVPSSLDDEVQDQEPCVGLPYEGGWGHVLHPSHIIPTSFPHPTIQVCLSTYGKDMKRVERALPSPSRNMA